MSQPSQDPAARLRWVAYCVLIVLSASSMAGRIATVESSAVGPDRTKTPFLSANDRSRWCTVRALVDQGTYAIDDLVNGKDPNWKTIDKVRHKASDGRDHFYSSKPPLLPTLLAGEYWLVQLLTGATLAEMPFYVGRILLTVTNVCPLILYFLVVVRLVERLGTTDMGRVFVVATATFGTFLTTMAVTINNHLPAAISVMLAIDLAVAIGYDGRREIWRFAAAGLFAAFAAANELPALSFLVLLGAMLMWKAPRQTAIGFVPAVLVVAACFFGTNYAAHGSWRPPYDHRADGPLIARLPEKLANELDLERIPNDLREAVDEDGFPLSATPAVQVRQPNKRWVLVDQVHGNRFALERVEGGIELRRWDNWYDYEGSYWLNAKGVDRGERCRGVYAFHVLFGHHGFFSLTPVWFLALVGMVMMWTPSRGGHSALAVSALLLSVVCVVFYVCFRPEQDRNYGGVCCGFRWLFWLIPLWLCMLIPAADAISSRRFWRVIAWILLSVSTFSAGYASLNPWSHPWIFSYCEYIQWISYP